MLNELFEKQLNVEQMVDELASYGTVIEGILDQMEMLVEADMGSMNSEGKPSFGAIGDQWAKLSQTLDGVMKQFDAAKRGLSIISRLPPGEDRAKHASRVMSNMNRIRGAVRRAENDLKAMAADPAGAAGETEPATI